ncbi:AcrR family transcriptional regulator [Kineosphaera limosa]|uniref:Putative TetR family transcriptional regulator n=1 Tax=Kineosphaera limosa NBRC 100340 TaxID=1184609 RepID=K6X7S4_9MICO|nr:TetR family transcriptional regulator [Kineosphaera limosa]NYD98843.1 AcrR family transcriptional regulator [Kineosphaera limosa]GAB94834.1 putative TetR family transcriptional regulator [Kineosphaera limosa NBRC 100340]
MHRRADVIAAALDILAEVGLPDLTMRRLGATLGVQQSAIYHHFANKQLLLGAVADEIVARGPHSSIEPDAPWPQRVRLACTDVHAAVLAYADGADVVMSMFAFGLGGQAAYDRLRSELRPSGLDEAVTASAARTLLHYVYGHAFDIQTRAQAARVGAIDPDSPEDDFAIGLTFVIDGIAGRANALGPAPSRE